MSKSFKVNNKNQVQEQKGKKALIITFVVIIVLIAISAFFVI